MTRVLACPSCNAQDLDVHDYESMMVLRADLALFALYCPHCGTRVSSLQPIPDDLREEVAFAAIEIGAGMGRG